jgi:small subunit ribosomal protein S6
MVLLDNRQVKEGWQQLKDAVTGFFTKSGAEILSAKRWEERRLAYPIMGQKRGTYLLVYYQAETGANPAIRRDLELSELTLRHIITTCEEVPATAYEPEADFDVDAIPLGSEEVRSEPEQEFEETPGEPEAVAAPDLVVEAGEVPVEVEEER